MEVLITIATLFVIGSLSGWILEVFYRRFVSRHRWMNPGFLVGPYLPIYGSGVVCLFGIARLGDLMTSVIPSPWNIIIEIVLITIAMTVVEYITGLIYIKGMGIKLWDYSNQWGNIQGIICPLYTLFWGIAGAGYLFLIDPFLIDVLMQVSTSTVYCFLIGIVMGMILVDTCYSNHLGIKLAKIAKENKILIKFDELKVALKEKERESGKKVKAFSTLVLAKTKEELKEITNELFKKKD